MRAQQAYNANPELKMSITITDRRIFGRMLWLVGSFGLAFCAFSTANAQTRQSQMQMQRGNSQMGVSPIVSPNVTFQEHRIKELNVERQKEMVAQTNELLKLTAQLSAEVAKNHSKDLTPDQLRMLTKIEKLAKSVREKMSNPVQGTIFQDNFPPPMAPPVIP